MILLWSDFIFNFTSKPQMARRQPTSEPARFSLYKLLISLLSCFAIFIFGSAIFRHSSGRVNDKDAVFWVSREEDGVVEEEEECCRGIERLELWGDAVKWGSDFKLRSSRECCLACKRTCEGRDGDTGCLCNSWVYCGDREACGDKFGECWLKKQKDALAPDKRDSGKHVMWTSGLVFRKGEGIVGLETKYGTLRIKLLPDCAPHSVAYILELIALRHCLGCHFYRVESRGNFWDSEGNHITSSGYGPPYALIQGMLGCEGIVFEDIPAEVCPIVKRGSVAWVGSGPDFFVSLANHNEWRKAYTVFGCVLPEDMEIAERIAELPSKTEGWGNVNVSVLVDFVPFHMRRMNSRSQLNPNLKNNVSAV